MRALALLLAVLALPAAAREWVAVPDSQLRFAGTSQGERFEGVFGHFDAHVTFDPQAPSQCRFQVEVRLRSADTRNAERDETLMSAEFFDVEVHPLAQWRAERCSVAGDGFVAHGTLELKDRSAAVPLEFRWREEAGGAALEGSARIDRMDFDIGTGDWSDPELIAPQVEVSTQLGLRLAEDAPP